MKTIFLAVTAFSIVGCTTTTTTTTTTTRVDRPLVTHKKVFVLTEQHLIGAWTGSTLPDHFSYRAVFEPKGEGWLVVSSDLADTPFFGIYKLSWSVSQPHNLRVKYSYHSGECQLKTLKLKWDAPYIQVQAEVEGFSWQHTSNLEPEKQLLERIERVKEVTDNRVDETPTASREVMKLTTASDIKGNLGREVLVEGIAGNASLGAVVLFGDTPIYLEKLKEWQSKVAGKRVRASGILQRFEVPTSRQDEYGNWSAGVSTGSYKLVDVKWAVIQP